MKKTVRNFLIATLSVLAIGATATACASSTEGKGPDYEYQWYAPLRAECDSFMTIDGKLDEEIWKDQNYLYWAGAKDNEIKATTIFTSKGLYVGMYAEDDNVTWKNRYAFDENAYIKIQVVKENEITYKNSRAYVHPTRQFVFNIDAKNTLSRMERRYDAKSYVQGELNGETEYMSAELFVPWSELGYKESELNENGCPQAVKLLIQYWTQTGHSGFPGFSDDNSFKTYYTYDADGSTCDFDRYSKDESIGYSVSGWTPGDKWVVDEENKTATNTVDRTQILWFRKDVNGNACSSGTHYVASVKVKSIQVDKMYPHVGIMTLAAKTKFNIYGVSTASLSKGTVYVSAGRETNGEQWVATKNFETTYKTNYTGATVGENMTLAADEAYLTVVKRGAELYYFVNDEYVGYEYDERMEEECIVGIFANGQTTVSDWSFEDYSNKQEELDDYLRKYVHFIDTTDNGGYVVSDKMVAKHGTSFNVSVTPKLGYVLTKLTLNGTDIYNDFVSNAVDAVLTYTPDKDVAIDAEFSKIPNKNMKDLFIKVTDNENESKTLSDATYVIRGKDNRFIYSGKVNSSGYIVGSLVKEGTYPLANEVTLTTDGKYSIEISCDGYVTKKFDFEIPNNFSEKEFEATYKLEAYPFGAVTVNGVTVKGAGSYEYEDKQKKVFTTQATAGNGSQYMRDSVFTGNYMFEGSVTLINDALYKDENNIWTYGAVSGYIFSSGKNYITMKSAAWIAGKLYIQCGSTEIGLSNFPIENENGNGGFYKAGAKLKFYVYRYNDVFYVYNCKKELGFTLGKSGLELVNSSIVEGQGNLKAFNSGLEKYFSEGNQNAIGMYRIAYGLGGGEYRYEFNYTNDENKLTQQFSTVNVALRENENYSLKAESKYAIGDGFLKGLNVTLNFANIPDNGSNYIVAVKYGDNDAELFNGEYNRENGTLTVTLPLNDDATVWLEEYGLGEVTVNGSTTKDIVGGILQETSSGYKNDFDDTLYIRQYYTDKKAVGDYIFNVEITVSDKTPEIASGWMTGSGVGVMLSAGGDNSLAFFTNSWEGTNLLIKVGGKGAASISVSGFPRDNSLKTVGSKLRFSIQRKGDALYFYNCNGTLIFHMDKYGIALDSATAQINGTEVTKDLVRQQVELMMNAGNETAFGIFREFNAKGSYEWKVLVASGDEMTWPDFWGEFIPDRNNTVLPKEEE